MKKILGPGGKLIKPTSFADKLKMRKVAEDLNKLLTGAVDSIHRQCATHPGGVPKLIEQMLADVFPMYVEHLYLLKKSQVSATDVALGGEILAMNIVRETIAMCFPATSHDAAMEVFLEFIKEKSGVPTADELADAHAAKTQH